MSKKKTEDLVQEAHLTRSAIAKFEGLAEPSAKAKKAHEALKSTLEKASAEIASKRESLMEVVQTETAAQNAKKRGGLIDDLRSL